MSLNAVTHSWGLLCVERTKAKRDARANDETYDRTNSQQSIMDENYFCVISKSEYMRLTFWFWTLGTWTQSEKFMNWLKWTNERTHYVDGFDAYLAVLKKTVYFSCIIILSKSGIFAAERKKKKNRWTKQVAITIRTCTKWEDSKLWNTCYTPRSHSMDITIHIVNLNAHCKYFRMYCVPWKRENNLVWRHGHGTQIYKKPAETAKTRKKRRRTRTFHEKYQIS